MLGDVSRWQLPGAQKTLRGEEEGVIPRAIRHLFQFIESKANVAFDVRCSFVELHRDNFIDLLDANFDDVSKRAKIEIRQQDSRVFLAGSESLRTPIHSIADALRVVADGQQRRQLASTKLNPQSSRSHAILTFYIKRQSLSATDQSVSYGKLHLIDLAGNEVCA